MQNISGYGLSASLVASNSFPTGFSITEFADDADPLDSPDLDLADTAFGLNGNMVIWSRPQGLEITIAVIPNSDADVNLKALVEANRVGFKKRGARDVVDMTINYPTGEIANLNSGAVVTGPFINRVASSGRFKTNAYRFRFENISRTNPNAQQA
jgi:hypothetical protein